MGALRSDFNPFVPQQLFLDGQEASPGVTGKASQAIARYHAMTGNHDGYRVGAARISDRAWTRTQVPGDCTIGRDLAHRNRAQLLPHLLLKRCSRNLQFDIKLRFRVREVGFQQLRNLSGNDAARRKQAMTPRQKHQLAKRVAGDADTQPSQRGINDSL